MDIPGTRGGSRGIALLTGAVGLALPLCPVRAEPAAAGDHPVSVPEMIAARTDVWGDAAMRRPGGASFEFFKDLLPPLRWVDAGFRHYPLALSAPLAEHKGRLVGNGSAVNARANKPPMWFEAGMPVTFYVGMPPQVFGQDPARLSGPHFLNGHLPIVQVTYSGTDDTTFMEEAFAPVTPEYAARGAIMLRFQVRDPKRKATDAITAQVTATGPCRIVDRSLVDEQGNSFISFAGGPSKSAAGTSRPEQVGPWSYRPESQWLEDRQLGADKYLVVFTRPGPPMAGFDAAVYEREREACVSAWQGLLDRSVRVDTPETLVNDAWRAMIVGNFMMAVGDRMHYSAQNAYAKLYQGECGDSMRSLLLYGYVDEARAMLKPLMAFHREDTRFHVAGHKLQLLAFYYWVTRDAASVRATESIWRPYLEMILKSREPGSGLLPKDRYAGDIAEKVYSLNSNANCWRGLRDLSAMLADMGKKEEAEQLLREAGGYREAILRAVEKSERRDTQPPFIPVALLANEEPHDPLPATQTGSYYDLIAPYIIGSEIFGQGSQREDWMLGYLQQHGGVAMGMIRVMQHQGQYKGEPGVNPLYGLRYQLALLRRDEREKALVGFYGHLAQGMTRNTFQGGEGSRFLHGDAQGRSFYLPPNSTSNALFLLTLRYLLIQDWDLDEDSRPDTLRLLYGAPRRWLADGQAIRLHKAPTMFGEVSIDVESKLTDGHVTVRVVTPPRPVKTLLLRAPLPAGWKATAAQVNGAAARIQEGDTLDLSGQSGSLEVRFEVKAVAPKHSP